MDPACLTRRAYIAIFLSAASILACVTIAPLLIDHVLETQQEIDEHSREFKELVVDTWRLLMNVQLRAKRQVGYGSAPKPDKKLKENTSEEIDMSEEEQVKITPKNGTANLNETVESSSCGPPGEDGEDGLDGSPGYPGPTGAEADDAKAAFAIPKDCKICPRGQEGDVGPRGEPGKQGPKGYKGRFGLDGQPGPMGRLGERGKSGQKGMFGTMGRPGKDGKDGTMGMKGSRGDKGPAGPVGSPGVRGMPGEAAGNGTPGSEGEIGIPGDDGKFGRPGMMGWMGRIGAMGTDGGYCPCPAASAVVSNGPFGGGSKEGYGGSEINNGHPDFGPSWHTDTEYSGFGHASIESSTEYRQRLKQLLTAMRI